MKKEGIIKYLLCLLIIFSSFPVYSQEQVTEQEEPPAQVQPQPETTQFQEELNIGRIYFPRDFVHANKDYKKGVYRVKLIAKEDVYYFQVSNRTGEFLFDELAVVKPYQGKSKRFKYRVKREMLRGYEYFRIKVTKPDNLIMAYFLVKAKEEKPPAEEEPEKNND